MPVPSDSSRELARLRSENEALNAQIKLLVQTEQRLYRSQNRLDVQLGRLRSLGRFALESTGNESVEPILQHGMDVLAEGFSFDWIGIVRYESPACRITLRSVHEGRMEDPATVPLDQEAFAWLTGARSPCVAVSLPDAPPPPAFRALTAIRGVGAAHGNGPAGGRIAVIPLRSVGDERPGAILAWIGPRPVAQVRDGLVSDEHLPFFQLLANHMDHQIANTRLTASLTERSAQLATSLERLEATQLQLVQAQKLEAVGRLAGGVAHDFNNLLTVILGYAGTLLEALPPGAHGRANVEHIVDAGKRAASITAQLLALSRRQIQRREAVDLSRHAEGTVDLLRRLVGERIRLELEVDATLPPIRADRSQLEQVLLNLVLNARDALPDGGWMRVVTRRASAAEAARCGGGVDPAGFAVLGVADSGTGMDAVTLERIFEPFFSTKASGKGSGLGLAVVYGIVKQSEGHVLVDSTPGRGSTFLVLLPFHPGGMETKGGGAAPEAAADHGPAQGAILVVEDEVAIRDVVSLTLRRAGYDVQVAEDGDQALRCLANGAPPPDLILTDVVMPTLGGIELGREVRRRGLATPLAYMSGYSEHLPQEFSGAMTPPAAFLPKPFSPRQLLDFVARQLPAQPGRPGA